MRKLTPLENQVADLIIDLRKSEVPSPNKIQRIVEMLEEERIWSGKAAHNQKHNQQYGRKSVFLGTPRSAIICS